MQLPEYVKNKHSLNVYNRWTRFTVVKLGTREISNSKTFTGDTVTKGNQTVNCLLFKRNGAADTDGVI